MRPVLLTIRGLNSFDAEQTIDFKTLTATGLFGIFGPTGSGKSSIVDALTLALYAKMSRFEGERGSKQFINTNCDEMHIKFVFESNDHVYTVERNFKRKGDTVNNYSARFYDAAANAEKILADKPESVTKEVENLIGLGYKDFSKSVVLPQGKFSEFLALGSKDRSTMLERIFKLERFGETFYRKIKEELTAVTNRLDILESNLNLLGEFSQGNLHTIKEEQEKTEAILTLLKKEKSETELKRSLLKEKERQYKEYQFYMAEQAALQMAHPDMEALRTKQKNGTKANGIQPMLQTWEESEQKKNETTKQWHATQALVEKLTSDENRVAKAHSEAFLLREKRLPVLLTQEANAKQAKALEAEIMEDEALYQKLRQEYKTQRDEARVMEARRKKAEARVTQINESIQQKQSQKEKTRITPERREGITEGMALWKKKQEDEAHKEQTQNKINAIEQEIRKETQLQKSIHTKLELCQKQIEEEETNARTALDKELMKKNKAKSDTFERMNIEKQKYEQAKQAWELAKQMNMAHALAKDLEEGAPCAVCGSQNHPLLAEPQEAVEEWNKAQAEAEMAWKATSESLQKIELDCVALAKESSFFLEGKRTSAKRDDLQQLQQQASGIVERQRLRAASLLEIQREKDSITEKIATYETPLSVYTQLCEGETFAECQARIKLDDQARITLEEEENNLRKEQENLRKHVEEILQTNAKAQSEMERVHVIGTEKKENLEKRKAQVAQLVGTQEIDAYLQTLQIEKTHMQKEEETLRQEKESLAKTLQQELEHKATLQTQLQMLEETVEKQKQETTKAMIEAGFACKETVLENCVAKKRLAEWEVTLAAYDGKVKIAQSHVQRLADTTVDIERVQTDIADCENKIHTVTENIEQKAEHFAIMKERIVTMEENLAKAQVLQVEKKEYEHGRALLSDLEQVLRGNKFVTFVAERQLQLITMEASARLKEMTNGRYALELDASEFVVRDDYNGGVRRSNKTLSGGEVFITSLCLALSLSSKIQQKSSTPLEFFFLDEGFGSLDPMLLDVVMTSLEHLQRERLLVGIITHVEELKTRVNRKLMVTPPKQGVHGSCVTLELSI